MAGGPATVCPGCLVSLPALATPTHPYIGASPACWALAGRALERCYGDPECGAILQVVVDAYACQHPGEPGRRSAQSVALHLMTLCVVLEDGADPRHGPVLHRRMLERLQPRWLAPPTRRGHLTVGSLVEAGPSSAFVDATWAWARDVWVAWKPHHGTVRRWVRESLG